MAMLQVRNLPDDVHDRLKSRAAEAGMTLSAYVGRELTRLAATPTFEELTRRAEERHSRLTLAEATTIIRAERDRRA